MKKIVALLMILVMTLAAVPSFAATGAAAGLVLNGEQGAAADTMPDGEQGAAVRLQDADTDADAIEAAQAQVRTCQAELDEQKALLEEAQLALDTAKASIDDAGGAFLNSKSGEQFTVEILIEQLKKDGSLQQYMNNNTFEAGVKSALTVENLIASSEFVDECNELRAKHGLQPLTINYRLMILSAVSAAVSSQVYQHAAVMAIYGGALGQLSNYVTPYPGENLAWGYSDSFEGWYYEEKKIFDEAVKSGNYPNLETMDAYEVSSTYPELSSEVGHYLNIIDPRNMETGFARIMGNTAVRATDEQSFSRDVRSAYGEAVTPAEFRTELNLFMAGYEAIVAEAQAAYDAQAAKVDEAKAKLDDAQKKLDELTGGGSTDPTDSTDPIGPADPTDPTKPDDPTDPTKPDDPTDPTKPDDPTDPTKPDDPTDPSDPDQPQTEPKATIIKKLTAAKKAFTVSWKKQTSGTTGYQIQYSLKKNFKSGTKKITIKKNTQTSKKITGLKSKKKYYVRIRTFSTANSETVYSAWSKAKAVTTK